MNSAMCMLVYTLSHIFTPCTISHIERMSTKRVSALLSVRLSHVHNGLNRLADKVSSRTNVARNNIVDPISPTPIKKAFSFVLDSILSIKILQSAYSVLTLRNKSWNRPDRLDFVSLSMQKFSMSYRDSVSEPIRSLILLSI